MRVIMFQPQFVDAVESGDKTQTMRVNAHCEPGDVLSLRHWSDKPYRSKQKIIRVEVCKSVDAACVNSSQKIVTVGGLLLKPLEADLFAKADGFSDSEAMFKWFNRVHEWLFQGHLIKW